MILREKAIGVVSQKGADGSESHPYPGYTYFINTFKRFKTSALQ